MNNDNQNKELIKKRTDKKIMTIFSIVIGIISIAVLIIAIVLKTSDNSFADGIFALFVLFLLFSISGFVILFFLKREINYLEHPELRPVKKAPSKYSSNKKYNDDGLSIEEIDFLESDIFEDK